jgi:hypothetical protein
MVLLPEIEWPAGGTSAAERPNRPDSRFVKNALDFADGRRRDLGDLEPSRDILPKRDAQKL